MEVEEGALRKVVIILVAAEHVTVYVYRAFTSMSSSWWGVVGGEILRGRYSHSDTLPEHVLEYRIVASHAEALVHRLGFVVGRVGVETEAGSALARAPFPRVPVELPEDALRAPFRHDVDALDPPCLLVPPV